MPITDSYSSTTTVDLEQTQISPYEPNGFRRVSAIQRTQRCPPRGPRDWKCSVGASNLSGGLWKQLQKGLVFFFLILI